jgi:hypothetical protein
MTFRRPNLDTGNARADTVANRRGLEAETGLLPLLRLLPKLALLRGNPEANRTMPEKLINQNWLASLKSISSRFGSDCLRPAGRARIEFTHALTAIRLLPSGPLAKSRISRASKLRAP